MCSKKCTKRKHDKDCLLESNKKTLSDCRTNKLPFIVLSTYNSLFNPKYHPGELSTFKVGDGSGIVYVVDEAHNLA